MSNEDRAHKEFIVQWDTAVEDMRVAKRQQWLITSYGIIIQTGIITFLKMIKESIGLSANENFGFAIISIIVFFISVQFLIHYQNVQRTCRITILKIQPYLSRFYHKENLGYGDQYASFWVNWHILILFIFALFLSMAIVIWYLFKLTEI